MVRWCPLSVQTLWVEFLAEKVELVFRGGRRLRQIVGYTKIPSNLLLHVSLGHTGMEALEHHLARLVVELEDTFVGDHELWPGARQSQSLAFAPALHVAWTDRKSVV